MRHTFDDGLGARDVWLDGFLLNRVIECDDVACTAVCAVYPLQVKDNELVTETVSGDVMVVRFFVENDRGSILWIRNEKSSRL